MRRERRAEKELHERRSAVEARQQLNDRMEERERARREIKLEAQGDLSEQAELALALAPALGRAEQP